MIKTIMTRKTLEEMVINTLNKGANMDLVYKLIKKLNIQIRG